MNLLIGHGRPDDRRSNSRGKRKGISKSRADEKNMAVGSGISIQEVRVWDQSSVSALLGNRMEIGNSSGFVKVIQLIAPFTRPGYLVPEGGRANAGINLTSDKVI